MSRLISIGGAGDEFRTFRVGFAYPFLGIEFAVLEELRFCLRNVLNSKRNGPYMAKFLIWCVLLVVCWPLALLALVLYPIVWVLLLPFRVVGIAVEGVLALVVAVIMLPARVLRAV